MEASMTTEQAAGNGHTDTWDEDERFDDGTSLEAGEQLLRLGENEQLTLNVGGMKPKTSSVRLVGGKIDIEGEVKKGQRLSLMIEVVIGEIAFVDAHDSQTGQVLSCERRHKARIVGVERANV